MKKSTVRSSRGARNVSTPGAKNLSEDEKKIIDHLNRHDSTDISVLAKLLDKSELGVAQILSELRGKGFDVAHDRVSKSVRLLRQDAGQQTPFDIPVKDELGTYRFAVFSDTRLGHCNQQLTLLNSAYRFCDRQLKIHFALHAGNLVAGDQPKSHREEVFLLDAEAQKNYAVKHYPHSGNFRTYIVAGQTDLSFKTKGGFNVVRAICQEREDLVYRGAVSAKFLIRQKFEIELMHPSTDNVPYAKTYTFQRILEQIIATINSAVSGFGLEDKLPDVVLAGGYHTPGLLPAYGSIDGFLLPSFISQTPRQKRKGISPMIGFWVIDVVFDTKTGELKNVKPTLYNWTHYQVREDYLNDVNNKEFESFTKDERLVLAMLMEGPQTLGELSRRLDRNKETVQGIVDRLIEKRKLAIEIPSDTKQVTWNRSLKERFSPLSDDVMKDMFVARLKVANDSDTHLCSRDQQISMLRASYEVADEEKVDLVHHTGDVTDGCGSVGYRTHGKDVFISGYTEQKDYVVDNYPKSKTGIKTKMIPGNHDWWDYESFGGDIVKDICAARPDLEYCSYPRHTYEQNGFRVMLFHPGGGSAYALSFQIQRHIMSQLRNKEKVVDAMFCGNWHKALYIMYAGVHGFLAPSMKGQDDLHQKLSLPNDRGMWIVEFTKDRQGRITKVVPDYRDFTHMTKEKDY